MVNKTFNLLVFLGALLGVGHAWSFGCPSNADMQNAIANQSPTVVAGGTIFHLDIMPGAAPSAVSFTHADLGPKDNKVVCYYGIGRATYQSLATPVCTINSGTTNVVPPGGEFKNSVTWYFARAPEDMVIVCN